MKIIAVIQARMGSKRLPGKALKKVLGKTLIEWIAYRLSFCKEINKVVLATSVRHENDELVKYAKEIGIECYRGEEEDLINRYLGVAETFSADLLIRITGDCPLVDPNVVDKMVKAYNKNILNIDLVTNVFPPSYPHGYDVDMTSIEVLKKLDKEIADPLYRECFMLYMMKNPKKYRILNVSNGVDLSQIRLTVDYEEDLELIDKIFTKLHMEGKVFNLQDVLGLLKEEPALSDINKKWNTVEIVGNTWEASI